MYDIIDGYWLFWSVALPSTKPVHKGSLKSVGFTTSERVASHFHASSSSTNLRLHYIKIKYPGHLDSVRRWYLQNRKLNNWSLCNQIQMPGLLCNQCNSPSFYFPKEFSDLKWRSRYLESSAEWKILDEGLKPCNAKLKKRISRPRLHHDPWPFYTAHTFAIYSYVNWT